MPPQISVVITAYQKAPFLRRALDSVLEQTFQEFEVIVVDDGSTDGTRGVVEEYVARDNRIRYIYQQNQGPGSARNTGIIASQSVLIALLDGDDAWLPDKLARQIMVMDTFHEIDLLFMDSHYISTAGSSDASYTPNYYRDYILSRFAPHPLKGLDGAYLIGDDRFACQLLQKNPFNLSTVMIRKHAWARIGGFNGDFRGPEDLDFWVRAALKKCQFAYLDRVGAIYFKNEASLVQASERSYMEQLKHALYAHQSPEYQVVRDATLGLVHRRFRQLVVFYAYQRRPERAWATFRQSLQFGLSLRTFLLAMSSFLGPGPLSIYRAIRGLMASHMS